MSHSDNKHVNNQPTRAGPQRSSSLDPTKTAKLLQKKPKHSTVNPATSLERKRVALNLSLSASAPELHQPDVDNTPQRERPSSTPLPPHPPLSNRRNSRRIPRQHKLDRIDELDESNPHGIALHHDGPYESIKPAPKNSPKPEPIQVKPVTPSPPPPPPSSLPKPTNVLPAEPSPSPPPPPQIHHLFPDQTLPKTVLRSYQSPSAQYTHFAPPRIQLIHNQQQHLPLPTPLGISNQVQPEFDPYVQFPLGQVPTTRPIRNHSQAPHRAHIPPRLRDQMHSHQPQRNMGPRMVQPMLVMPTPQRPANVLSPFPQFDPPQPVIPPGLTLAQHMQPKMSPEVDAFAHLPAGILRMNTPSPPPAEPERNPLLTPVRSTFDAGSGLVRRQSLPLHAPQRTAAPPPNPVDAVFCQVKQTALPSVASAPMIAPFYQQEQPTTRPPPSSRSHESLAKSDESSVANTQLPTPPDQSPIGSRLMREDRLQLVVEQTDVTGLPTPESTPSPRPSPERGLRSFEALPKAQQVPVLADYMSRDRVQYRTEDDFYPEPVHYPRGELGHEPLRDDDLEALGPSQRSFSNQSVFAWSEMSEMGHERVPMSFAPPPPPPPPPTTFDNASVVTSVSNPGTRPRARRIPKHLVMPAPLGQPPSVEDEYQEAYNAAASLLFSATNKSSTSVLPSGAAPPVLVHHHHHHHQQQRNVLRKRTGAVPVPPMMATTMPLFPIMNTSLVGLKSVSSVKLGGGGPDGQRAPRRLSKKRTDL